MGADSATVFPDGFLMLRLTRLPPMGTLTPVMCADWLIRTQPGTSTLIGADPFSRS